MKYEISRSVQGRLFERQISPTLSHNSIYVGWLERAVATPGGQDDLQRCLPTSAVLYSHLSCSLWGIK